MPWDPDVEQRPHPFGEAGVRSSLEEVCKRAAEGASELLGNPKHLARVRTWAIERLHRAKQRGEPFAQPGDRARILLKAVQDEKLWVPDPIGIEYIPKAHLMACDGDTHDDGTPCVKGDDCFAQGTLVLTDEQVGETFVSIPVERLQAGMKIWGLERWSVVEAVWSKGDLDVDEIEFDNGTRVCLTPDHHVYVIEGGIEHRITVAELKPGAVVPRPATPGIETSGVARRGVRGITRNIGKAPCWDITTDDHRVYLPEHDVTVSQCDGKIVFLAACFMSVGLYTMIVGHSYERNGTIGHVLTKVYFNQKWHYADASPLGSGKYLPLGKSTPFTRERYYSMPTIKVVCDAASCDVRNFDPQELGFIEKGTFVGLNGIAVMEMPPVVEWLGAARAPVVEWLGEARAPVVEWLGATYKADDKLSKAIIANKGDTSEEALKQYATVAGAIGGAAVCAAFGAPAASPVCGAIAGAVIGWIADKVPVAQGSDTSTMVIDTWKQSTAPMLKWSQRAMLGVKAYYVMRDDAITQAVALGATEQWAENYLNSHGMTMEPVKGRWAPTADRYNHPLACASEPCASVQSLAKGSYWEECSAAKKLGIDLGCREYLQLTYGPWPPIAAKGDAIDWGLIALDEIAMQYPLKGTLKGKCARAAFPPGGGKTIYFTCPTARPSQWARDQIIKLKLVQAKMLTDAKGGGSSTSTSSSSSSGLKVVLGGAALAAAIWAGIAFL